MKNDVRLGIIGLGNMGNFYARVIFDGKVPGMRLAAVCDMDKEQEIWNLSGSYCPVVGYCPGG